MPRKKYQTNKASAPSECRPSYNFRPSTVVDSARHNDDASASVAARGVRSQKRRLRSDSDPSSKRRHRISNSKAEDTSLSLRVERLAKMIRSISKQKAYLQSSSCDTDSPRPHSRASKNATSDRRPSFIRKNKTNVVKEALIASGLTVATSSAQADMPASSATAKTSRYSICPQDGELTRVGNMDIDHVYPYSRIKQKQEAFLRYLNQPENKQLADKLLQQKGIRKYFDNTEGKIKRSKDLDRLCYNDYSNVALICHHCNISKKTTSPLQWARKAFLLGEQFVKKIEADGGVQEGLFIARVYNPSVADITLDIGDGFSVNLPPNPGKGLGEAIRDWLNQPGIHALLCLKTNFFKDVFDQYNQNVNKLLAAQFWEEEETTEAATQTYAVQELEIITFVLASLLDQMIRRVDIGSSQLEGSPLVVARETGQYIQEEGEQVMETVEYLNQLYDMLRAQGYEKDFVIQGLIVQGLLVKQHQERKRNGTDSTPLSEKQWQAIVSEVKTKLKPQQENPDNRLSDQDLKQWFDTLFEKHCVRVQKDHAIEEKEHAIEEKDHAIEEKDYAIEEKDHAIEEKDHALVKAEQSAAALRIENEKLQAQVAQLTQQHSAASSAASPLHVAATFYHLCGSPKEDVSAAVADSAESEEAESFSHNCS